MRIALVHASDLGGGAERSVVSLHRALRAAGHGSTLFVGERHTDEPGIEQIPYARGVPGSRRVARALEQRFGWQDIYNPSFRALARMLEARFDVVHFNSLWGSAGYADLAALPAITRSVPGVITLRDYWMLTGHCAVFMDCMRWQQGCGNCPDLTLQPAIPHDGTRSNWNRKHRAVAASNLHVVTISDDLRRQVESSPMFSGKPVSRIYNGIDLDVFRPLDAAQRLEQRRAMGLADSDVVVLLAGQTVEGWRQGIATHHAVAALNAWPSQAGARALLIGRSAGHVASMLQMPATVLPFQDAPEAMARCFQVADLTLVTSEVEAFGRIGAESQACGTPVIAFDSGGIPEVVRDGIGGLVVPCRDTDALTAALARMLCDAGLRQRMAEGGLAHARANFDQNGVTEQYLALYRSVANRDRKHDDAAVA